MSTTVWQQSEGELKPDQGSCEQRHTPAGALEEGMAQAVKVVKDTR